MAILTLPDVIKRAKVSRSTLLAMVDRGEFPKPFKLGGEGGRKNGWTDRQVDAWEAGLEAKVTADAG